MRYSSVFYADIRVGALVRAAGGGVMITLYSLAAFIAGGLLIYLVIALLKPEMFP